MANFSICALRLEVNWLRGLYIIVFFCNAIFATIFKTIGEEILSTFGTFDDCNRNKNASCRGNQIIFRASFSISLFFLMRALLSRFGWVQPHARAAQLLIWIELPVLTALLIGSFFLPSSFFDDYATFSRVASGFFILFQIFSIVSVAYQVRDTLLERIENAEKVESRGDRKKDPCTGSVCIWKAAFLGLCVSSLIGVGIGIAFLYVEYGECSLGLIFTTITVVAAGLLIIICVSNWLDVGLLPPCAISAYLVLMCWQALISNPNKSCESSSFSSVGDESENANSVLANALVGSFAMTWTSWRTSSAATKLLVRRTRTPHRSPPVGQRPNRSQPHFSGVVIVDAAAPQHTDESVPGIAVVAPVDAPLAGRELVHEPWQFYSMMCLAGLYMAMVLTDWDSADGSSNSVSMWVKIVAQWVTILLFSWTLIAPKLFPNRDFT